MREARVGRVLVASLHQAIADVLPTRLGFYENWLSAEGMREGTIGPAPLYAVLSFLRQEGAPYGPVMTRAGQYAAEWTVESMSPARRRLTGALPPFIRGRVLLARAGALVRSSYGGTRVRSKVRRGVARVDLRASVFCSVREPVAQPLCGFYASAFERMLALFDIESAVAVVSCRGMGDAECVLSVSLTVAARVEQAEAG